MILLKVNDGTEEATALLVKLGLEVESEDAENRNPHYTVQFWRRYGMIVEFIQTGR
jgi:hypothetical protein